MKKPEMLSLLAGKVGECRKCSELAETRNQTVFARGNPYAQIMIVGEAPGKNEDIEGLPFVGKAGQLLDGILATCGLTHEHVYIANVLKCRPPSNRKPAPEECMNCDPFLKLQIDIINPKYLLCLGSVAAQHLLKTRESISSLRGRWFDYGKIKLLCTYHPAYLLRNPAAKKDVWEDLQLLRNVLSPSN